MNIATKVEYTVMSSERFKPAISSFSSKFISDIFLKFILIKSIVFWVELVSYKAFNLTKSLVIFSNRSCFFCSVSLSYFEIRRFSGFLKTVMLLVFVKTPLSSFVLLWMCFTSVKACSLFTSFFYLSGSL